MRIDESCNGDEGPIGNMDRSQLQAQSRPATVSLVISAPGSSDIDDFSVCVDFDGQLDFVEERLKQSVVYKCLNISELCH